MMHSIDDMADCHYLYEHVPPGQIRHDDPMPTLRDEVISAGVIMTVIAGSAVIMRLYTALFVLRRRLAAGEYLTMVAIVMSLLLFISQRKATYHGFTYHDWDIVVCNQKE